MISVITYGRNDNYSYNLVKRTALGLNALAEILSEEDEILFVDYNTPDHLPTLPEFIWDSFTEKALNLIKVIRVSSVVHQEAKGDSPLPILENVSRNAAIVRSNANNRWILSTNPDVILVLASRWANLGELLKDTPDSFYEMPRFDIPESVWSGLRRHEAARNAQMLRDWLIQREAAVVETVPDYRFQRYYLFDAPGDFQLAPRHYYMRLRGFDESMNRYFHSDSNLAKRMWLLNGRRTDHLLGHVWVLHQDHYLSGEWTRTVTTVEHNDYHAKVIHEDRIEANDEGWGLQRVALPMFSLGKKVERQSAFLPCQASISPNGDLPLSTEIDWQMQPFYRLCHYRPRLLATYLREVLQVVPAESRIAYLGENRETLECVQKEWMDIHPDAKPAASLLDLAELGELSSPDLLLVDCFFTRSEYWERRVQLLGDQLQRQVAKGRLRQEEADEELSRFADTTDWENQREQLVSLWNRFLPSLRFRPGVFVVLLGCNVYVPTFEKFQETLGELSGGIEVLEEGMTRLQKLHAFYQRFKYAMQKAEAHSWIVKLLWTLRLVKRRVFRKILGFESIMGMIYFYHLTRRRRLISARLNLRTLYMHHRLVVMRVEAAPVLPNKKSRS